MNTIYSPKTTFQITFLVLQTLLCEQAICKNIDNQIGILKRRMGYVKDIHNNINYPLDTSPHTSYINSNPGSDFKSIQTFSQQVDARIVSTFLTKESLHKLISEGSDTESIVRNLYIYKDHLYELGMAYNHLHQLTFSHIESRQDGIPKDMIYTLVAHQQQIYQKIKNLFTGSYRFWMQQYENPYYVITFEEFLSKLPEYKGQNGYSFDVSNDIEDPANSFYLNQYILCRSSIQNITKQAQEALLVLRNIENTYINSNNDAQLLDQLKVFKHKNLDPIYKELNIVLALYNKISQDQVFYYLRFQTTNTNSSIVKILDQDMQSIGFIERDQSKQQIQGPCDAVFEAYNKLLMLSQINEGASR